MICCALCPYAHIHSEGHFDIVKCLITEGHCHVNIADSFGDTPLHWACR